MKNIKLSILILSVIFITSTIFISCSSENEDPKLEFLSQLKNFNTEYQLNVIDKQTKSTIQTKDGSGFWNSLGKALVIAGADIAGAGAGASAVQAVAVGVGAATAGTGYVAVTAGAAIITGAGASVAAASTVSNASSRNYSNFGKEVYANLNIQYPNEFSYLSKIGLNHNKKLFEHYNGITSKSSQDDIFETEEFNTINLEIQESVRNYVNNNFEINFLTTDLENKGYLSNNMKLVLDNFFEIYNNSENEDNIEVIVNFYINAIADTQVLKNSDKNALISSFSVASESPTYWLNQN